ncbi:glycosyltransferase [Kosakonia oryziphila]|uniref:Glycosyltransferase involved in cell wall bisynthesis n=1 Tax=Kosakonia oryziphila TaxID=1005667 RepID=A0A1C4AL52_9ENTR|nr:glycosyltransferase [Kosakonia oryziphila]SCB95301.1 Glycosyltransferase involved in cell wall bisynthesis [Kosakonia oryziphila]
MLKQKEKTWFDSLRVVKDVRNLDETPFFSILVRMKNEEKMLPHFIKSLSAQLTSYNYELIFLDSESKDNSVEIVMENCKNFIIYAINANEFSFSKTCNFLVECARAPNCILLSAHIEMIGDDFLQRLGEEIEKGSECGYFRQVVNHNNGYSLYDVLTLNKSFPARKETKIFSMADKIGLRFSNAGSFFKTNLAIETAFPDVAASEDFLWAISVIDKNHHVHYIPSLTIAHSHNESLKDITKRVNINKRVLYGDKPAYKKSFIMFVVLFLMLLFSGSGLKKSCAYASAHAKGYLK